MWIWHSESERFLRNLFGLRDLENVLPIEAVYEQISLKDPTVKVLHHSSFLSFLLLHCIDLIIVELQIKFCDLPKNWWRHKTLSKSVRSTYFQKTTSNDLGGHGGQRNLEPLRSTLKDEK